MAIPNEPLTRTEQYLNRTATGGGTIPEFPLTRAEQYLNKIATGDGETPEMPLTRMEQYLDYIAENGSGGGSGGGGGGSSQIVNVSMATADDTTTMTFLDDGFTVGDMFALVSSGTNVVFKETDVDEEGTSYRFSFPIGVASFAFSGSTMYMVVIYNYTTASNVVLLGANDGTIMQTM